MGFSPLMVYNHDCPYCGAKDGISFVDSNGKFTTYSKTKQLYGARCMFCNKEFAINWTCDTDGKEIYYFSDLDLFISEFINIFEEIEERDIDNYLVI